MKKTSLTSTMRKIIALIISVIFVAQNAFAQMTPWGVGMMPTAGTRVAVSMSKQAPVLKGVMLNQQDPFRFDFIMDVGKNAMSQEQKEQQALRLMRYFLASLTTPDTDLWVNLSPYEENQIIPNNFGQTEMGRDLLAQDYLLKQLTASLLFPEEELGHRFWNHLYNEAFTRFGTTDIPMQSFHKVWIVPKQATVLENEGKAFIMEAELDIMMEEDYLMRQDHLRGLSPYEQNQMNAGQDAEKLHSDMMKELIVPIIKQEVNTGEHFAPLRQIYHSLILAEWFKRKLKAQAKEATSLDASLSRHVQRFAPYLNQSKTSGITHENPGMQDYIYNQYLDALKKGVYNYVKEEYDPMLDELIPRKYFSGGALLHFPDGAMRVVTPSQVDTSLLADAALTSDIITGEFRPTDQAMPAEARVLNLSEVDRQFMADRLQEAEVAYRAIWQDLLTYLLSDEIDDEIERKIEERHRPFITAQHEEVQPGTFDSYFRWENPESFPSGSNLSHDDWSDLGRSIGTLVVTGAIRNADAGIPTVQGDEWDLRPVLGFMISLAESKADDVQGHSWVYNDYRRELMSKIQKLREKMDRVFGFFNKRIAPSRAVRMDIDTSSRLYLHPERFDQVTVNRAPTTFPLANAKATITEMKGQFDVIIDQTLAFLRGGDTPATIDITEWNGFLKADGNLRSRLIDQPADTEVLHALHTTLTDSFADGSTGDAVADPSIAIDVSNILVPILSGITFGSSLAEITDDLSGVEGPIARLEAASQFLQRLESLEQAQVHYTTGGIPYFHIDLYDQAMQTTVETITPDERQTLEILLEETTAALNGVTAAFEAGKAVDEQIIGQWGDFFADYAGGQVDVYFKVNAGAELPPGRLHEILLTNPQTDSRREQLSPLLEALFITLTKGSSSFELQDLSTPTVDTDLRSVVGTLTMAIGLFAMDIPKESALDEPTRVNLYRRINAAKGMLQKLPTMSHVTVHYTDKGAPFLHYDLYDKAMTAQDTPAADAIVLTTADDRRLMSEKANAAIKQFTDYFHEIWVYLEQNQLEGELDEKIAEWQSFMQGRNEGSFRGFFQWPEYSDTGTDLRTLGNAIIYTVTTENITPQNSALASMEDVGSLPGILQEMISLAQEKSKGSKEWADFQSRALHLERQMSGFIGMLARTSVLHIIQLHLSSTGQLFLHQDQYNQAVREPTIEILQPEDIEAIRQTRQAFETILSETGKMVAPYLPEAQGEKVLPTENQLRAWEAFFAFKGTMDQLLTTDPQTEKPRKVLSPGLEGVREVLTEKIIDDNVVGVQAPETLDMHQMNLATTMGLLGTFPADDIAVLYAPDKERIENVIALLTAIEEKGRVRVHYQKGGGPYIHRDHYDPDTAMVVATETTEPAIAEDRMVNNSAELKASITRVRSGLSDLMNIFQGAIADNDRLNLEWASFFERFEIEEDHFLAIVQAHATRSAEHEAFVTSLSIGELMIEQDGQTLSLGNVDMITMLQTIKFYFQTRARGAKPNNDVIQSIREHHTHILKFCDYVEAADQLATYEHATTGQTFLHFYLDVRQIPEQGLLAYTELIHGQLSGMMADIDRMSVGIDVTRSSIGHNSRVMVQSFRRALEEENTPTPRSLLAAALAEGPDIDAQKFGVDPHQWDVGRQLSAASFWVQEDSARFARRMNSKAKADVSFAADVQTTLDNMEVTTNFLAHIMNPLTTHLPVIMDKQGRLLYDPRVMDFAITSVTPTANTAPAKTGGIDLNPQALNLNLDQQGQSFGPNIDHAMIAGGPEYDGLYPVVINTRPAGDMRMLLGLRK